MGVEVIKADWNSVTLRAPLAPNINHRETVFGGSASAVAILAAWAILYVRLHQEHVNGRLAIQRNTMTYERSIASTFEASSTLQDSLVWERFLRTFTRKKLARISIAATLRCNEKEVGRFEGDFVALKMKQD